MADIPFTATKATPLLESAATPMEADSTEFPIFPDNDGATPPLPRRGIAYTGSETGSTFPEHKVNSANPQLHSRFPGIQSHNPNASEEAYLIPTTDMSKIRGEYRVWESKYFDMVWHTSLPSLPVNAIAMCCICLYYFLPSTLLPAQDALGFTKIQWSLHTTAPVFVVSRQQSPCCWFVASYTMLNYIHAALI